MDYGLDTKSTRLKTFNTIFIITWLLIGGMQYPPLIP